MSAGGKDPLEGSVGLEGEMLELGAELQERRGDKGCCGSEFEGDKGWGEAGEQVRDRA